MAIIDITGGYLYWQRGREKVRIEAWGKDALRVRATKNAEIDLKEDWALLPKGEIEGVELCRDWRAAGVTQPILFLTAKDEEFDVVRGLDAGGNDYVSKPFRVQELLSRIRALLRRTAAPVVHSTGFEIDQEKMQVRKDGEVLPLTLTEYRVLLMLIQHGSVVTRSSLLELLWDDGAKFVDDNTLSVHMSRLRDKVGAEHIRTVRGVGYQWVE